PLPRPCGQHATSSFVEVNRGYGGPGRRLPFPLSAGPACLDAQQDMKTMAGLSRPAPGTRTSAALGPCASNGQGIQPTQERPTIPAFTAARKSRHSSRVKTSTGPPRSLLSLTATTPLRLVATSTQLPPSLPV